MALIKKREYSAIDGQQVVIYGKRDAESTDAYPMEYKIPWDTQVIDEADPNNVTIAYKVNGSTIATKTILVSGTTTTITVIYA